MFETAEVGNTLDKETYKREVPRIRAELLDVQKELAASGMAVVVLVSGVEGAGKTETVNQLLEWLDARGVETHVMDQPTDDERERPAMWRFWLNLPPKGRMGIFLGSWYTQPIVDRVFGKTSDGGFHRELDHIMEFETMLAREGVLVVKFWLHLKEKALKKRMAELAEDRFQRWRVTERDVKFVKKYDKFRRVSEQALLHTSTGDCPWHIVEAADPRYRHVTVASTLIAKMREGLSERTAAGVPKRAPDLSKPPAKSILRSADLTRTLKEKAYERRLIEAQAELNQLTRRLHQKKHSMILVFEGPDAAGKGGAIRRLTGAIDARTYRVISVAAPTDEERAHPYLWRFWRHLPRLGRVTIYDRSWYGRVLVERVEGFCAREEWQRAYSEINCFEECLADFGTILIKFWLAVSPREQLNRFKDRQVTPYKQYKITEEDWRNRAKWDAYEAAAVEMIGKTSTSQAPWVVVPAEDKNHARIQVLETVVKRLKRELG